MQRFKQMGLKAWFGQAAAAGAAAAATAAAGGLDTAQQAVSQVATLNARARTSP